MRLLISSKKHNQLTLVLKDGSQTVDTVEVEFDRDLDTVLIKTIDKILKRNRMTRKQLQLDLARDIDQKSSLYKVLRAFQAASEVE